MHLPKHCGPKRQIRIQIEGKSVAIGVARHGCIHLQLYPGNQTQHLADCQDHRTMTLPTSLAFSAAARAFKPATRAVNSGSARHLANTGSLARNQCRA